MHPAPVIVRFSTLTSDQRCIIFSCPFHIGRADFCEVTIDNEYVSRVHAEVVFNKGNWCIRDLNSSNGLYLNGDRVKQAFIAEPVTIRFGVEGPEIRFEPQDQAQPEPEPVGRDISSCRSAPVVQEDFPNCKTPSPTSGTVLRKYVDHYFSDSASSALAGEHTMYVRRAFAAVQKKQKRNYALIIALMLLLAISAGSYAFYEY